MSKSTHSAKGIKPKKPYPDFPLFPHPNGLWCKKIRNRPHYFGPWRDPDGALQRYLDVKDDLHAGRTPRKTSDGLKVKELVNRFLTLKESQVGTGEIVQRSFLDYLRVCGHIAEAFGLAKSVADIGPDDFELLKKNLAKTRGIVALGSEINRVRVVFNFSYKERLIDKPVHFGTAFQRPPKRVLRKARQANGPRMFESEQLRAMLEAAPLQLRGMILLATNAGFGNHDCGTLPISALDLKRGWVTHPRPKTAVERRAPLWPETIEVLREVLEKQPLTKEDARGLVFITRCGEPWARDIYRSPLSAEFRKLLNGLGLYRKGLGFYTLRHVFGTIGSESRDQVAVDYIMGHERGDMGSAYRERISDERLEAVVDHVHQWLFESKVKAK